MKMSGFFIFQRQKLAFVSEENKKDRKPKVAGFS